MAFLETGSLSPAAIVRAVAARLRYHEAVPGFIEQTGDAYHRGVR
jgi:hypothetical protein